MLANSTFCGQPLGSNTRFLSLLLVALPSNGEFSPGLNIWFWFFPFCCCGQTKFCCSCVCGVPARNCLLPCFCLCLAEHHAECCKRCLEHRAKHCLKHHAKCCLLKHLHAIWHASVDSQCCGQSCQVPVVSVSNQRTCRAGFRGCCCSFHCCSARRLPSG
jgi:hypothetical protein